MNIKLAPAELFYAIIIGCALALTSCSKIVPLVAPPANTATAPKVPVTYYSPLNNPEFSDIEKELRTKLQARDMTALEELAKTYREKKERLKGGAWKVRSFYSLISLPLADQPSDPDWEQLFAFLHEWKEKHPNSITPRVALADAYLNSKYGTKVR